MIYELREYYIAPGKVETLHRMFREKLLEFFEKHDIKVVGYWNVKVGENPKLIYLCQFRDFKHFDEAWKSIRSDQEWIEAKKEYTKDGPLTIKTESTILTPTDYSPLK